VLTCIWNSRKAIYCRLNAIKHGTLFLKHYKLKVVCICMPLYDFYSYVYGLWLSVYASLIVWSYLLNAYDL